MTEKQRKFCVNFVRNRNAYKAALEAGYSESYSKSRAFELLKIKEIATEVERLESDYYKQTFKELALKGLHAIGEIIESNENSSARLRAVEFVFKQAGAFDQSNFDEELTITVVMPKGLEDDIG